MKTTVCITCAVAGILMSIGARSDPNPETKNTVASQYYVDTMDATKQNKIPATGTNSGTPGSTVVTYTGTAGTIGERGIYSGDTTYNSNNDSNKLVTASVVANMASTVETLTVPDNKLVCANSPDCTLWTITNTTANVASAGTFAPLTAPACAANGQSCNSTSDCCPPPEGVLAHVSCTMGICRLVHDGGSSD